MLPAFARIGLIFSVIVAMIVATLAPASAKDKRAEAKLHYENGMRKFELNKFDEAADEFVQAYELVGDPPSLLYNIAQAYRLAEKFEKSAQFYRSFLRKMPEVANRAEIEGRIVEMDERAADQKRQAERRAAEQREAERKAELKRQEALQHKNDPPNNNNETRPEPKGEEPKPREVVEDDRPRPGRALKITGYALCGLAGAALGVGIAMTVLAVQASHKVEDAAARGDTFDTSLRDTESKGQVFDKVQIAGYALAGAAAIGAGLAIYFGFRAEKQAQQQDDVPPSQAARRRRLARIPLIAPAVDAHGGGFVLEARF